MQVAILVLSLSAVTFAEHIPYEVFSWNILDFAWPSPQARQAAIDCGQFIPENTALFSITRWHDRLFVAAPRFRPGVPATLCYIKLSDAKYGKSPKLYPYPSWEANVRPQEGECIEDWRVVSAEAVKIDEYDRLWVLDWGFEGLQPWTNRTNLSPPAIVIYDLLTNKLVKRYVFKETDYTPNSKFNDMVLETTSCGDIVAYITDAFGFGLTVFSLRQNDSWRIQHNFFLPDPLNGYIDYNKLKFAIPLGLYGFTLSDVQCDGYRTAYFHAIGSTKEFQVSTRVLMNATYANSIDAYFEYKVSGDKGPNTITRTSVIDKAGIIYFALTSYIISCWNTAVPLNPDNFNTVLDCGRQVVEAYGLTVDDDQNLWVLISNMPYVLIDSIDPHVINHRVLKMSSEEARSACQICS